MALKESAAPRVALTFDCKGMLMDIESVGQTLAGRFRLEALLGEGGMGCVFSARDLVLERNVAVKVMRREYWSQADIIARFVREAKVLAGLASNPHILSIYDLCFSKDRIPFIVAERLYGRSLKIFLRSEERPSRSWVLEVAVQVAVALLDVHAHGVTHRDIKPGNIFIVETPAISLLTKVIDFGLSQSPQFAAAGGSDSESLLGTIKYVAPEVIDGGEPTLAADIYSFGVTLYELATGEYPYAAGSKEEILSAHRQLAPKAFPGDDFPFPQSFRALVMQMMSKSPAARPSTALCLQELRRANRDLDASKSRA